MRYGAISSTMLWGQGWNFNPAVSELGGGGGVWITVPWALALNTSAAAKVGCESNYQN